MGKDTKKLTKKRKKILIIVSIVVLFFVVWALIKLPICLAFSPLNPTRIFSCTLMDFADFVFRALFGFRGLFS